MKHADFRLGLEFYTATGAWRCTDIGARVVTAVKLGQPDPTVYDGPPYAVAEFVFDEDDQAAASLRPQRLVVVGTLETRSASSRATAAADALRRDIERLRRVCAEAYQFAAAVGAPARVLDALWAASEGKAALSDSFLPVSPDECVRSEST